MSALTAFLVCTLSLLVLILLTQQERRRGRRFFAPRLRSWLDRFVHRAEQGILRQWSHFLKFIVQLHWYYGIHSILRTILRALVALYSYFETMFERNRKRAKALRSEKKNLDKSNHLQQMTTHKADTALSPAEKRQLRKRTLEGKDWCLESTGKIIVFLLGFADYRNE